MRDYRSYLLRQTLFVIWMLITGTDNQTYIVSVCHMRDVKIFKRSHNLTPLCLFFRLISGSNVVT